MKKKFLNLYIIDSIVTFLILILFFVLSLTTKEDTGVNFAGLFKYYYLTIVLLVVAISLVITVALLFRRKYSLDVDSTILPISYLVFTALIVIVAFILNYYVVIKNMHFVYIYRFIIIDYILLNAYTIFSFKK